MTMTHQQADDLLAAYALGSVERDEATDIRGHLDRCAACQETFRRLQSAVDVLAFTAPEATPPAGLGARILQQARGESIPGIEPAPLRRASGLLHAPQRRWAPRFAAIVAVVGVAGLGVWNVGLQHQIADQRAEIAGLQSKQVTATFTGTGPTSGELIYLPQQRLALVSLRDLPPRQDGRVYELWVLPRGGGAPRPSGTFIPEADGSKLVALSGDLSSAGGMAVSVEPAGGSAAPTTAPFISASL